MAMGRQSGMNYLFLDASQNNTIAQIGTNTGFITESFDTDRNLAARITAICDEMLVKAGLVREQIDMFAVCTGPGSLTGLRVAAAFLRTMALLVDKPLTGIDLFTWSLQTLSDQGKSGPVRLVMPTLIDKAFESTANLPGIDHSQPVLIERAALASPEVKTYGIRFSHDGVEALEPDAKSLHRMLLEGRIAPARGMNEILGVLPLYVIPSQAERKFKEAQ